MTKNTLYIIDLDRTLVDVEKVMETARDSCEALGIGFNQIDRKYRELAAKEIPYSPLQDIKKHTTLIEFNKKFIELSQNNRLLFDDSPEFIARLKSKKIDHIILTYGIDDEWQILKIEAAGLSSIPVVIIKDRYKSRVINSWYSGGRFKPDSSELATYDNCVVVDDRIIAFDELPDNCRGYLLDRAGKIRDPAKLSDSIQLIRSLSEVSI